MRASSAWLACAALVACGGGDDAAASSGVGGAGPVEAYPTLGALAASAVAPGCAAQVGVCHAGKAYPNLRDLGELAATIDAPCQLGEPDSARVLDACEVRGDDVVALTAEGAEIAEILRAVVDPAEPVPAERVTLVLARELEPPGPTTVVRVRRAASAAHAALEVTLAGATFTAGDDARSWRADLAAATRATRLFLDPRATSAEHAHVVQGDPNGNGVAHADASPMRLVVPGDPERSVLYRRVRDADLGAAMPPTTGVWTSSATRALYCWIKALPLDASGTRASDADAPIATHDAACPPDPAAREPERGGFPAVEKLFAARCASSACHSSARAEAGLVLEADSTGWRDTLVGAPSTQVPGALRVAPGQPDASYLVCKLDIACTARAEATALMPPTGAPLTTDELALVRAWIARGAPLE